MKKFLSLFISSIMLFNLTAEVFAAPIQFVTEKEEKDIRSAVGSAYNSSSSSTANFAALERNYNNALKDLAEISDAYGNLEDAVNAAIAAEMVENGDWEILNNAISRQEKDLEKYNNVLKSYEDKVNKLGGMENIEKQYALYQQWIDLKPQMDQRKAELENIIKTSEDKSAVKAAKQELDEYKKNYYSHENEFNKFKKDFDDISQDEEYLQGEAKRFEGLSDLEERTAQRSQEAKQAILDLLPEDSGLSLDSDWDALFDAAQKEADKMIPMLEEAKTKFERAESAQDNAYQKYLENKFENEFTQTLAEYCEAVSADAEKYQRPAEWGKVNGHAVAIEPGSILRRADGTLVGDVKESLKWEKIKGVYLACTNPSWDEDKLKSWGSTVTMKELGDVKYGEYLLKYSFEEGKKLSDSEKKQMGQALAKKNIGMIIIDPERGLDYYYTLYGDYNQSKKLAKYFYEDWSKYGTRDAIWEENEFGDMEETNTYELVPTTEEGVALEKTYNYRLLNYENTRDIIRNYFYELNILMIDIMNYLASNASNGARGIDGYLETIGVSFSEDFLDINKDIIREKVEEINSSLSQEEKEGIVETKVTKRPFSPLMCAMGPSHLIDRNRTLVRERRSALQGFDLNMQGWHYLEQKKEPQPIMDLLVFNANLQTSYRLYKPNLEAWNNLAYGAYKEEAMYFLAAMTALGQQMHDKYEEMPTQYYEEIEESFHEEGKDIILDIGVGILMGGVASIANAAKTFISSTVKVVIKNSIKVAFKSGFKQGVKAFGKRSITLTKVGLKKSVKNVSKTLKGAFKVGDMKAMTNAHRSMLNPSTKANVNAFKQIKFKSPLRGTSHTLGRQQGTIFTRAISDIKAQYGIRPAKTSKIFNADLTKQQIAKLSTDLDDFYKMKKAYKPATATPSVPAGVPLDAIQIKNIQEAFNRSLGSTKYELFGQRGGVAAMSIVPVPPGAMDFLTGKATLKQIFNRNPLVTRIFNKSSKKVMKAIEKEGLNPEQAKELFFKEFEGRVNSSPFMPKARKKSLIEQVTGKSMGEPTYTLGGDPKKVMIPVEDISAKPVTAKPATKPTTTAKPRTPAARAEQYFKENPKDDFYLDSDTGRSFENPAHAKRMRELQAQRDAQKAAAKPQAPARRVSPLQENSMDSNPFEKYENTSSKGGMNYDNYKYKPSATNPGVKSGLDGSVGGIQRRIMDMTSDAQSASKSAAKSSTEKTYTLGGDPKKVMVPVEDVSATPTNAQVTAKPKYLGATPNANGVTILIKTPSGKTFAENISQEGLAILSRGDTINLGYATLDKNTLSFLQNVAKVDPAIAKNLKAAKKPGFFENLFGKKGVAEPAVEKTYTLGGDPKKVMVPVKENVPAKPEYLAINPKANEVDILIKTPSGKKVSATLSREDLALLYRGETINLGEVTLDKDTLRFLQDIAKDDPIIAKNLQAAKKPGFFENLFGKKGVAEPAVEKTYTLGGDSKKVMIPAEENAPVKSNITGKVKDPAQAYKNAYNSGVVELNENELVRFNGNGGKAVNQDYIQASKDARKYMIDAVESGEYTASTDSYMQTMNEMHRVSANGKSGNLDWYKDAGQGKMSVNPGEIRTGGRPRNSRIEQAQKVEEIAKKYGDPFKVTGNSLVDLPGIPTNNLPANRYVDGQFFHYYPKGGETLRPYYRQMHRTAKEAVSLINQQASEREILEKLAEHYQYAANARPYGQINNSLFMNEVNTLLQKAGLRPIPHGELDIAAMHLQPNTFKKYFVDTYYKTKL